MNAVAFPWFPRFRWAWYLGVSQFEFPLEFPRRMDCDVPRAARCVQSRTSVSRRRFAASRLAAFTHQDGPRPPSATATGGMRPLPHQMRRLGDAKPPVHPSYTCLHHRPIFKSRQLFGQLPTTAGGGVWQRWRMSGDAAHWRQAADTLLRPTVTSLASQGSKALRVTIVGMPRTRPRRRTIATGRTREYGMSCGIVLFCR